MSDESESKKRKSDKKADKAAPKKNKKDDSKKSDAKKETDGKKKSDSEKKKPRVLTAAESKKIDDLAELEDRCDDRFSHPLLKRAIRPLNGPHRPGDPEDADDLAIAEAVEEVNAIFAKYDAKGRLKATS
jgi:hypothetical protein